MFNFRLKIFQSIATNLSFTQTANELYITQPAVTKNIKELEKELGIDLFERKKSGISLTEAGHIFLHYTEQVLEQEHRLKYDISTLKQNFEGSIRIGASTTVGQYVLPRVLASFNQQFPDIKLSLSADNTRNVERALINNEIDLGLVEGNSKKKELHYTPFMRDEIVLICHSSQKLSEKISVSLDQLKTIPLVLRERGSGSLDVIAENLNKHSIKLKDLNIQMHLGSTESIKSYLTNCNCAGLVSIHAVNKELTSGYFKIIDIENFEIVRNFSFIHSQGQLNGFAMKFVGFAMKFLERT